MDEDRKHLDPFVLLVYHDEHPLQSQKPPAIAGGSVLYDDEDVVGIVLDDDVGC